MADLPARPDLGQLRHQAKDLLRAARTGDQAGLSRIQAAAARVTLAGAQRAIAREYGIGRAARMLAATPAIAGYDLATAVLLGDADRVRDELRRDPGAATRPDPRWGWTPLH